MAFFNFDSTLEPSHKYMVHLKQRVDNTYDWDTGPIFYKNVEDLKEDFFVSVDRFGVSYNAFRKGFNKILIHDLDEKKEILPKDIWPSELGKTNR